MTAPGTGETANVSLADEIVRLRALGVPDLSELEQLERTAVMDLEEGITHSKQASSDGVTLTTASAERILACVARLQRTAPGGAEAPDDPLTEARLDGAGMLFTAISEKANAKDIEANGPNPPLMRRSLHAVTLTMAEILRALAETELEIARSIPTLEAPDVCASVGCGAAAEWRDQTGGATWCDRCRRAIQDADSANGATPTIFARIAASRVSPTDEPARMGRSSRRQDRLG